MGTASPIATASCVASAPAAWAPLLPLALQLAFGLAMRGRVQRAVAGVEQAAEELKVLAGLLARLEQATFQAPLLTSSQARLLTNGEAPSRVVARLTAHIDRMHHQQNQFLLPILSLLLWRTVQRV